MNINDIRDKNINILIGSGASVGLFPTLALKIKNEEGETLSIETLATRLETTKTLDCKHTLLFMHYYKQCIEPAIKFDIASAKADPDQKIVIENYEKFIKTLIDILQRRNNFEKRCNIFTTNYDGCIAHVADEIIQHGNVDFVLNDGTRGFSRRYLQANNFNSFVCQTGIFERHHTDIPQINLINLHGSVYWQKDEECISVNYSPDIDKKIITVDFPETLTEFSETLLDEGKTITDLPDTYLSNNDINQFWEGYRKLPIVNPTKWKFHETVFEEHYYQMLRLLSYELEKPNSIIITFGFSFSDEHILNLVKRSLSNPSLQVFICCFDDTELQNMEHQFKAHKNVSYITLEQNLDFSVFNEKVLTTSKTTPVAATISEEPASELVAEPLGGDA